MDWLGQTSYQETVYEEQWKAAESLGELCKQNNIRCFIMKGFSLAALYPKPMHRSGSDMDSYCIKQFQKVSGISEGFKCVGDELDAILEKDGLHIDRNYYKNSKLCYKGLTIENHQHVLPVKGSKKAKRLESLLLGFLVPEFSQFLGSSYLERPAPMFLAVHTLAHAQEHFFEEVINLRHVTDWAVILRKFQVSKFQVSSSQEPSKKPETQKQETTFDWNECLAICKEFGLLEFCYAMSRLANRICGVEIPFECPENERANSLLLKDIMTVKHSNADNDNHRRIELIANILRDSWKFKYFSDTNALMFALRRIWGYLFDKE